MLSGKRAFAGGSAADTMSAILREDPPELTTAEPSLSTALDRIVRRCLEKDPQHRFHSAHDLAFALESVTGVGMSGALARPSEIPAAAVPAGKRRPALVRIGAAALLVLALAAAAAWLAGYRLVRSGAGGRAVAAATFQPLTTQAGVELFPTISPDGKTFVYVGYSSGNADLYLQRVDGRNAINLTRDTPEADIQPAFSPDGSQIAFRSERGGGGIFLMGATGESVRRLTDSGFNPAWSPDGREIVVADEGIQTPLSRNVKSRLWAVDVATGAKRIVTPGNAVQSSWSGDAVQPSWSPHGHRIAYWGHRPGHHRDIWTVPAVPVAGAKPGEGEVPVTADPAVDWNPVWSPDGTWLYFSSDRNGTMNLWRVGIDEKTGKVLGKPEPVTAPSRWVGHMSIAADGRRMVYASADETSIVETVPFDPVGGRVTGEPAPLLSGALLVREIGISPDGKWISFSSRGTREDLFVASSDGSSLRQLTSDAFRERGADWSADGKRIVFYSDRTGRWEFWSVNPDGSGLTQLTRGTVDPWSARWSPDGARLAFPDGYNSYLLPLGRPLGTEKPEPLPRFDAAGDAFAVSSWSADGRALAGTLTRPDGSEVPGIIEYRIDSQQYRRLTDFGDDAKWLSDSRRLLVGESSTGRIHLVDSASGKSVPVLDRLRLRPGERSGSGIGIVRAKFGISRDDRTIFLVTDHGEADIWQIELEGSAAGK
jgi:Tol biopolymer transport system component